MAFLERWGSFWKKKNLSNNEVYLYWILDLERKNSDFRQTKSTGMPIFCSISPEEQFEESNVVKKKHSFVFFRLWTENGEKLHKKFLAAFCKLKIRYPGIKIHHISWCSMTHFVSFRVLAEVLWKVYRNCFLRALRIVLTEDEFFRIKNCFIEEFRIQSKKSWDFRQTKSAGMPKIWSISPKEHFEKNNVVQNKNPLVFFRFWAINIGTLPQKIWLRFLNCKLKVKKIHFSSHFLMFGDAFCQFPTFSKDFLEGLSKWLSLSAEDRFDRKKSSSEQRSVFNEFRS